MIQAFCASTLKPSQYPATSAIVSRWLYSWDCALSFACVSIRWQSQLEGRLTGTRDKIFNKASSNLPCVLRGSPALCFPPFFACSAWAGLGQWNGARQVLCPYLMLPSYNDSFKFKIMRLELDFEEKAYELKDRLENVPSYNALRSCYVVDLPDPWRLANFDL